MKKVYIIFLLLGFLVWLGANPSVAILFDGPIVVSLIAKYLIAKKQKKKIRLLFPRKSGC